MYTWVLQWMGCTYMILGIHEECIPRGSVTAAICQYDIIYQDK